MPSTVSRRFAFGLLVSIAFAIPANADICTGNDMNFAGSLTYTGDSDSLLTGVLRGYSDFGGVSLNKTLTLLNDVDDIVGAAYDPAKGEIVLVGEGEIPVALQIDMDDLVVAARTVYSVDSQGFSIDPGVSFDSDNANRPKFDGKHEVRFTGATRNTAFGQILFEADYALKTLAQGVDINGVLLRNNSALASLGYMSSAERYITHGIDLGDKEVQFWFTPKDIVLQANSQAGTGEKSFVFTTMEMQVCVRVYTVTGGVRALDFDSCVQGAVASTPLQTQSVAFANNITANYDAYSDVPGFDEKRGQTPFRAGVREETREAGEKGSDPFSG